MDQAEVDRCDADLAKLRREVANPDRGDIVRLAERLGFALPKKKGGHPVYKKSGCLPVTIPGHRNQLNKITVGKILDRLEEELDRLRGGIGNGS